MVDIIINWFSVFPPQLATTLMAMLPVTELRASIPVALAVYDMPWTEVLVYSLLGDIIPAFFIIPLLGPVSRFLMKYSKVLARFFDYIFERTRNKFTAKYEKYGLLALVVFVAIPLPGTGVWTGSLAAWLFGNG